jgi:hypothetical protein
MAVRHVVEPLASEARQVTWQEEVYAEDMYGTSPWAGADPTKGLVGQKIKWLFDPDTRQGVNGEWKIPEDRVPGTPVKVYFDYFMEGGPGGALVLWAFTYVVVEVGGNVNATASVRSVQDTTLGQYIRTLTDPIVLPASLFDGKRTPIELQCTFNRWADDAVGDTDPNNADLDKVIFEYTAYN